MAGARFDPDAAHVETGVEPFPWVVADGGFDAGVLARVLDEWPDLDDERWTRYRAQQEFRKLEGSDDAMWSPAAASVLRALADDATITWIVERLGLPDAELSAETVGGGYHTTVAGGYLAPHADFIGHPVDGRWRRANVLLFLVPDYDPEWGGCLRLGEPGSSTERLVEPRFGRLVAFETSASSWHGHPDPWLGPLPRRSLAAYYFSPLPVPDSVDKHATRWYSDEAARLEIASLREALARAEAAVEVARHGAARADVLDAQVRTLEQRLTDLEHSRSWRLTEPMRRLTDRLRALRGP